MSAKPFRMRRAIPHLILAVMTVGALSAAALSYTSAFADTPRLNATPTLSVSTGACPSTPESASYEAALSTDLKPADTAAYPITGDHGFVLVAPKGGKCQSQSAPLAAIKPIMVAGNATVTAGVWSGTSVQPYIQVIAASGVAAAALTCSVSAKAATDLVAYGEPKSLISQECAPFTDQLKLTYTDNEVNYYASRDVVTQGNAVVAVRYDNSSATPTALLVSCGWNASSGNEVNCYDYIASVLATNK